MSPARAIRKITLLGVVALALVGAASAQDNHTTSQTSERRSSFRPMIGLSQSQIPQLTLQPSQNQQSGPQQINQGFQQGFQLPQGITQSGQPAQTHSQLNGNQIRSLTGIRTTIVR